MKTIYLCGPLTELPVQDHPRIKGFYSRAADRIGQVTGQRGFAPHEHYDPVMFAHFTPKEIDAAERNKVCNETCLLVVMAIAPSWGGGIEVEMANRSKVPAILLHPKGKKVSRLLRGNPAIVETIEYESDEDALEKLGAWLSAGNFYPSEEPVFQYGP